MSYLENTTAEVTNVCDYCKLAGCCPTNPKNIFTAECDSIDLVEDAFMEYTMIADEDVIML